jgi:ABC-type dipeptide/oligopeptide/nickel transport system permease subunit
MLVAVMLAIPLGVVAAVWRGTAIDYGAMTFALAGVSIPNFWLGPLLAIVFAVELGWLPVSGRGTFAHLVLPAISLGSALAAILARMTRASLLDELNELYVRAARARGVSNAASITRHALGNSLVPLLTIIALQFGAVLTGAVITETIFAWPGIGRLLIQSIGFRDYPMVQGCILLIAVTYVSVNLITDLIRFYRSADQARMTRSGAIIVATVVVAALTAPWLLPWDAATQDPPNRLQGPTWQHWFGRELGRDNPRESARRSVSLMVGSVVVGVSSILGMAIGGVSGYYGG